MIDRKSPSDKDTITQRLAKLEQIDAKHTEYYKTLLQKLA